MAKRPVFKAVAVFPYVEVIQTEFIYFPGFSPSQAQKSAESLHHSYLEKYPEDSGKILEVSTKSTMPLGNALSAFNLRYRMSNGDDIPLECVFQAGKCFENGNQYKDLLKASAREAKRDPRLRESGKLVKFELEGRSFPLVPRTLFYDWLYIAALMQHERLAEEIMAYAAFTDIAFNPEKSTNCQARSVALYVALRTADKLAEAMKDVETFQRLVYPKESTEAAVQEPQRTRQLTLFDSEVFTTRD